MTSLSLDRLALLIVSGSQSASLMEQLGQEGFQFTVIDSTGGVVQESVICLLVGFHSERMPALLDVVRKNCHIYRQYIPTRGVMFGEYAGPPMMEAQLGGASVYMMDVERFEQF